MNIAEKQHLVDKRIWGRTIWDWLKLGGILLVPIVLAFGTGALSVAQDRVTQSRHDIDQKIAEENRQEEALSMYRNIVIGFLIDKSLLTAKDGSSVRMATVELTRNEFKVLDGQHKGALVSFLADLGLLKGDRNQPLPIGSLRWDDLRDANLEVDDLSGADLRNANLTNAKVKPQQLRQTWSIAGAILPDGRQCSEHEDEGVCIKHYEHSYQQNPQKYQVQP